ncbi:MAG: CRISPR-associated helicase Cas3' [Myxococcota bacterium]
MTILAKGLTHGELTLQQHLRDTEQAALALFRPGTRWGARWPSFFRLDEGGQRQFLVELRVAALFHDIGKANDDFQVAVRSKAFRPQSMRHEHISALIMCLPAMRAWLAKASIDLDICCAAVLSHHLKATDRDGECPWGEFQDRHQPRLRLDDEQVQATLERIRLVLGISELPPALPAGELRIVEPWSAALSWGRSAAREFRRALPRDDDRRRRLVAVKVGLIVSDAVASGLFRTGDGIDAWVERIAHARALTSDDIRRDVLDRRLASLGRGARLHPFQEQAATIGDRGLLLAACGAGKTLAAWNWARARAAERPIGRVIFLYPTRGTATEGYRDYAGWAPEGDAMLLHGSADYELQQMLENPPESVRGKQVKPTESEDRLYALGFWGRRYFSATVDQFLAAMEHRYESLCLLPALADAAVIVDEVHSFDPRMFKALVAFLKEFEVPVLCMTATLPASRRDQLVELGMREFPSKEELSKLADLEARERAPRYRLRRIPGAEEAMTRALDVFREGRRVLWVVNQVSRAQDLARSLSAAIGAPVLCYHSRFRLLDRQRAHAATVAAFQGEAGPAIAVTTQVCEMSLDLDADLLVTEECPVTSLVQRFGRANRHLRRSFAELLTYSPTSELPYSRRDLVGVDEFLQSLHERTICQAELAEYIEQLTTDEVRARGDSSLFESGYFAWPREFRDLDQYARPSILDADLDEARGLLAARRSIAPLIVPVPRRFASSAPAGFPGWLGTAASEDYHPSLGFIAPESVKETC